MHKHRTALLGEVLVDAVVGFQRIAVWRKAVEVGVKSRRAGHQREHQGGREQSGQHQDGQGRFGEARSGTVGEGLKALHLHRGPTGRFGS